MSINFLLLHIGLGNFFEMVDFYVFQSECLKEAFSELDMTSDILQILMSPDPPYFRLSTFGNAGSTHVRVQSQKRAVITLRKKG